MSSECVSKKEPKILLVAVHGPYEPWLSILKNGQLVTWMTSPSRIKIINVFGIKVSSRVLKVDQWMYFLRWHPIKVVAYSSLMLEVILKKALRTSIYSPKVKRVNLESLGDVWEVQMPDSLLLQGVKSISVFRESLNEDFDYLVTTITSSYINELALLKVLSESPRQEFLGGRIEFSGEMRYQQGSFRVYSRDVVEFIVENSRRYQHWKIEDIAMGNLVNRKYRKFTELPNMTVASVGDLIEEENEELKKMCSIRCKSVDEKGVRLDPEIMKLIHKLLKCA